MPEIEAKLKEISDVVYYGSADEADKLTLWNYIVFFRDTTKRGANNTGFTDYFTVGIVQENWVPDELIDAAIAKLETLPGVKLSSADIDYNYTRKPGTSAVVEVASMTFCRARKRVK